MPPETPDSGPFSEQRLIIVLGRRRRAINHTNVFILTLTGTFDPLQPARLETLRRLNLIGLC